MYPATVAPEWAYSSMVFAWGLTEVVRYGYYALSLLGGEFYPLLWMRYINLT
jgi:Protein tyrosine phosphatase-like protein, PTPLA